MLTVQLMPFRLKLLISYRSNFNKQFLHRTTPVLNVASLFVRFLTLDRTLLNFSDNLISRTDLQILNFINDPKVKILSNAVATSCKNSCCSKIGLLNTQRLSKNTLEQNTAKSDKNRSTYLNKILFSRQNGLSLGGAVYDRERTAHLALLHTTAERLSDNDRTSRGGGATVCNRGQLALKDQNLKQDRTTNVLLLNLQCVRYQLEFLFGIGKKSAGFSHFRGSATFSVEPNMVLNRFTLIYSNKTVTVWSKKMNPNFPLIFQISWFELTKKRDSFFVIPTPS